MSSYINHHEIGGAGRCIHDWRKHTHQRLEWQYGPERAATIMAGFDPKTRADLQAWRDLGKPKGRVA